MQSGNPAAGSQELDNQAGGSPDSPEAVGRTRVGNPEADSRAADRPARVDTTAAADNPVRAGNPEADSPALPERVGRNPAAVGDKPLAANRDPLGARSPADTPVVVAHRTILSITAGIDNVRLRQATHASA